MSLGIPLPLPRQHSLWTAPSGKFVSFLADLGQKSSVMCNLLFPVGLYNYNTP